MKKLILLFLSLMGSSLAQVAPQPIPEIEHLQGSQYLFSWHGVPGRVYFIQTSSRAPSAQGFSWEFAPDLRVGDGTQLEMGFEADSAKSEFFRLVYVDDSGSQDPYYDADFEDFDGDGYSNLQEAMENTDPFNAESKPIGIKLYKDSDGDGIPDQDETALGLDPHTADDPNSPEVREAGPLLISHSVFHKYYYQAGSVWHPDAPGYVASKISGGPQDGYRISAPWNLEGFRSWVNGIDFPREGDELDRHKAYVRKFNNLGEIFPSPVSRSFESIDSSGDKTRELELQKTAHMLKLPFVSDTDHKYQVLAIPRYSIQERLAASVTPGPAGETEEERKIRIFGIEDQGIYVDEIRVKTFTFEPSNFVELSKKTSNIIELEHEITQVREDLWTVEVIDLLPIDICITKRYEADAPKDGLVVKNSDWVRYRLFGVGTPDEPVLLKDEIQWYWRILKWDGNYGAWKPFQDGQGHTFIANPKDSGIYEVKATFNDEDFFFTRKRDDPHSEKKKGENDCFGVVDEQWQINVRDAAKEALGSEAYALNAHFDTGVIGGDIGIDDPKCNLFVGHKAGEGGAGVPLVNGAGIFRYYPLANQWAGMSRPVIEGWTLLPRATHPQPGWIVARCNTGGSGHTGIVGYDGAWISAGTYDVNRNADLRSSDYNDVDPVTPQGPARLNKYNP